MSNKLSNKLERIDNAVNTIRTKVALPEAAIEEVAAAVEALGGSEGGKPNIYKVNTLAERDAITDMVAEDICVVHQKTLGNITASSKFQTAVMPDVVTLPTALDSSARVDLMFRATSNDVMFDAWGSLTATSLSMDCFTDSGNITVSYTSSDGKTYTRTSPTDANVDFGTEIYCPYPEYWDDAVGYFFQVETKIFSGIYEYTTVEKTVIKEREDKTYCFKNGNPLRSQELMFITGITFAPDGYIYACDYHYIFNYIMPSAGQPAFNLFLKDDGYVYLQITGRDVSYLSYHYVNGTSKLVQSVGTGTDKTVQHKLWKLSGDYLFLTSTSHPEPVKVYTDETLSTVLTTSETYEFVNTTETKWDYLGLGDKFTVEELDAGSRVYTSRGLVEGTNPIGATGIPDSIKMLQYMVHFDTELIKDNKLNYLFKDCKATEIPVTKMIDASRTTTLEGTFQNCTNVKTLDLSSFNVNITDTNNYSILSLFENCENLEEIIGLENLTCGYYILNYTFKNCRKLKRIDMRNYRFATGTVISPAREMFMNCTSLEYLDMRNMNVAGYANYNYTWAANNNFLGVPSDCTIIVKDDACKTYVKEGYTLNNVYTVAEWQALGNE